MLLPSFSSPQKLWLCTKAGQKRPFPSGLTITAVRCWGLATLLLTGPPACKLRSSPVWLSIPCQWRPTCIHTASEGLSFLTLRGSSAHQGLCWQGSAVQAHLTVLSASCPAHQHTAASAHLLVWVQTPGVCFFLLLSLGSKRLEAQRIIISYCVSDIATPILDLQFWPFGHDCNINAWLAPVNACNAAAPKNWGMSDRLDTIYDPITKAASFLLQSSPPTAQETSLSRATSIDGSKFSALQTPGGCLRDVLVRLSPTCHPVTRSHFGFLSLTISAGCDRTLTSGILILP